jgi:predicted enzyme related to lactoylglutathione lyase
MVKHIAFTMYPVKDMARARKFYEDGLGLQMTSDYQGKWVEYHLLNGAFAITTMAEGVTPSAKAGGSIAFEVDDVDATMAKLAESGGKITVPAFDTPGCRMGFAADSEGNGLCVHAKKPGRD